MDPLQLSPLLPGPITPGRSETPEDNRAAAASDFDSFLTLLTAQLRNQDPLSPLESTEFVAQLATFSAVEQQIVTNDRIEALTEQSFAGDIASFANWIGNEISLQDGTFRANGEEVSFAVPRVAGADTVRASVISADGTELAAFDINASNGDEGLWDGLDQSGSTLSGQNVRIQLEYREDGAVLSTLAAEVPRLVTGLRGTPGGLVLDLADGGEAAPENVGRIASPD
ncbi:MAG: flagellar hook assembly protein FlgD [Paracoccaceae bacterium]